MQLSLGDVASMLHLTSAPSTREHVQGITQEDPCFGHQLIRNIRPQLLAQRCTYLELDTLFS